MKVLAAVFNPIEFDGRVQRAAGALSHMGDVIVFCPRSGSEFDDSCFPFRVVRARQFPTRLLGIIKHALFWIELWLLAVRERPALIHAHDYFMAFPGWVAAKISGARLVYDAHELIIPDAGQGQSFRDKVWYVLERSVIRRAQLVIAANSERATIMTKHYLLFEAPLVVRNIPPFDRSIRYSSQIRSELRKQWLNEHEASGKVLVYQGDVALDRGIDRLLEAMVFTPPDIRLVIIGSGPDISAVRLLIQSRAMERKVILAGRVTRDRLPELLSACDLGSITYSFKGQNNIFCAPNKIFEYAQAGIPVITTDQPPLVSMLDRYRIGLLVPSAATAQEYAMLISEAFEEKASLRAAIPQFLADMTWENESLRLRERVQRMA